MQEQIIYLEGRLKQIEKERDTLRAWIESIFEYSAVFGTKNNALGRVEASCREAIRRSHSRPPKLGAHMGEEQARMLIRGAGG